MKRFYPSHLFDLISPDGYITKFKKINDREAKVTVLISDISPDFLGFDIDPSLVSFNIKSTLAQIGIDGIGTEYSLQKKKKRATAQISLIAYSPLAELLLNSLTPGAFIGKLFAADDRRKVRDPDYLLRMFNRLDEQKRPLLYLGNSQNSKEIILEKKGSHTVAFLSLLQGAVSYEETAKGLIPIISTALHKTDLQLRPLLQLLQNLKTSAPRTLKENEILLVKTQPLHIRTVFAQVSKEFLPDGFHHTSANILEPNTKGSGDIYELFGTSTSEITNIPLEFFTLEPYREHVFFSDRDQLQECLEDKNAIFQTFKTANFPDHHRAAVFIVKGEQLLNLKSSDWISTSPEMHPFPGIIHSPEKQAVLVEKYIKEQPIFPFVKAMEDGFITSQGVLFSRFFPSPLVKKNLLSSQVCQFLKRIYFQKPSLSSGNFFSHEDRAMLHDLAHFAIPVYWADETTGQLLQYIPKPGKDTGMFVPLPLINDFLKATSFGIYGSNLLSTNLEGELFELFQGLETLRHEIEHPLLSKDTPIALITGGGPGVMEVGNKVAKSLNLLSCANIVDFSNKHTTVINEQLQNPYVDIKMTYHLDRLIERQAEFYLDFPIFLEGGIGTDFEYSLEELRKKVGSSSANPVLLFGSPEYWKDKVSSRFKRNLASGTISGSEWVSNCFFCIQNAKQGLNIYKRFLSNNLDIGPEGPVYEDGFFIVE
jgi:predicted Rossmann-fold nucleotide-binding protein